jgi:DNA-binding NtrC family response regulator
VVVWPSLRNRRQDIPPLFEQFLNSAHAEGLADFRPNAETFATMLVYDWLGNVRELKHCTGEDHCHSTRGAMVVARGM